ncbi:hypothetical protein ZWY2020_034386 [Hordeum vulgare]|nr:hypothetical protein ZWY2020_034386 [Hordeum vulgare]
MRRAVAESPVLVVGRRGCCLSHVVKRLLQGLGVNPAVHEVADEAEHAAAVTGDEAVVALPSPFEADRSRCTRRSRIARDSCRCGRSGPRRPRPRARAARRARRRGATAGRR